MTQVTHPVGVPEKRVSLIGNALATALSACVRIRLQSASCAVQSNIR